MVIKMINLNELPTTALITLINEMSKTSRFIDEIDDRMESGKLQPYEVEYYIRELKNQELYYRLIEDEIIKRGWMNEREKREPIIRKNK